MSEKTLQTSKKRLSNGKWSYRNYVLEKDGSEWKIVDKDYFGDSKSDTVKELKPEKTIKGLCLKIDEVLGDLPESIKKKRTPKKKVKTEEETNELLSKARKLAYDVRWDLENELEKDNNDESLKNKLAIPLGQGNKVGKTGFSIKWNKKFNQFNSLLESYKEKYGEEAEFEYEESDNITELTVKIKD